MSSTMPNGGFGIFALCFRLESLSGLCNNSVMAIYSRNSVAVDGAG